jgi:branched-chain amino acid aminotransferase
MKICVEQKFTRAAPGGVGYAKNAGNYGAAMHPTAEAKRKGFDQVLWTDAFEHKYVQECGTMNVFFIINETAYTPGLDEGTILAGVTRESTITLLKEIGLNVEERALSIDEIVEAYQANTLHEAFGTGTAATVSMIKELCYKDFNMKFDLNKWKIAPLIKQRMSDIKLGKTPDLYNWMYKV